MYAGACRLGLVGVGVVVHGAVVCLVTVGAGLRVGVLRVNCGG